MSRSDRESRIEGRVDWNRRSLRSTDLDGASSPGRNALIDKLYYIYVFPGTRIRTDGAMRVRIAVVTAGVAVLVVSAAILTGTGPVMTEARHAAGGTDHSADGRVAGVQSGPSDADPLGLPLDPSKPLLPPPNDPPLPLDPVPHDPDPTDAPLPGDSPLPAVPLPYDPPPFDPPLPGDPLPSTPSGDPVGGSPASGPSVPAGNGGFR